MQRSFSRPVTARTVSHIDAGRGSMVMPQNGGTWAAPGVDVPGHGAVVDGSSAESAVPVDQPSQPPGVAQHISRVHPLVDRSHERERPKGSVVDSLDARLSESAGVDDPKWPAVEEARRGLLGSADLRSIVAASDLLVREDQCSSRRG